MNKQGPIDADSCEALAWHDLDFEEVGLSLMTAVLTSCHLGHAHPSSTARDYLHSTRPEQSFVRDVVSGERTETLIQRWFGGPDEAGKVIGALLEAAIAKE